jgi:transforming growth factor-beta-induced protein
MKILTMLALVLTLATGQSCDSTTNPQDPGSDDQSQQSSIYETARTNGNFKTLTLALEITELDKVLDAAGDYTVFAPTDAAFDKLPAGTLDSLVKNPAALTEILLYHVAQGRLLAQDALAEDKIKTLDGRKVMVDTSAGAKINQSNIVATDIAATNGVIHVIDQVLIPADRNLIEVLEKQGKFKTLLAALSATGLEEVVANAKDFTIFAPNDDAFGLLPDGTVEALLKDKKALSNILLYHVVAAKVPASVAITLDEATMANNLKVDVELRGSDLFVNDSQVIETDLNAANGVIHVIDEVLIP